METNPSFGTVNDVVCSQCGKKVPVLNSALHLLRCQKRDSNIHVDNNENDTINTMDTDGKGSRIKKEDPTRVLDIRRSSHNIDIGSDEWECSFCTFINSNTERDQHNENDHPLCCSMCYNEADPFHDSTWRNSDATTGRRQGDELDDDGQGEEEVEDDDLLLAALSLREDNQQADSEDRYTDGSEENINSDSDSDDSLTPYLSTWTCSHCSIVNLSCEHNCQMCDMPDSSTSSGTSTSNGQSLTAPRSQSLLESTVPALCYLGLTVGALLTDSTRGSSTRMRNGLIGSMVGTMAGVALGVLMSPPWVEEVLPPRVEIDSSAAARLPVHRYQCKPKNAKELNLKRSGCSVSSGGAHVDQLKQKDSKAGAGAGAGDEAGDDDKVSCRICMEEYEHGVEIKTLRCFHMFHADCIDQWLSRKTSCPLCCTDI